MFSFLEIYTNYARFQGFSSWPISVSDSLQGYGIQHGSAQLSPYVKLTLQLNSRALTSYKLGIAMYAWNTMISPQQTGYRYRPAGETLKRCIQITIKNMYKISSNWLQRHLPSFGRMVKSDVDWKVLTWHVCLKICNNAEIKDFWISYECN